MQKVSIAWDVEGDGYDMNIYFYEGSVHSITARFLSWCRGLYYGHEFVRYGGNGYVGQMAGL